MESRPLEPHEEIKHRILPIKVGLLIETIFTDFGNKISSPSSPPSISI